MGFLTGFGIGFVGQADQEFNQDQSSYNAQMLQRQNAVDKVAEQWSKDQDKMTGIKNKQLGYQSEYNIPSDQAYTLAQDPGFEKLAPNDRVDFVKSMKPVQNAYTAPQPGGPQQVVPGGQTAGVQLGPFHIPGKQLPPINTPSYPGQPARQIYEAGGTDPQRTATLKMLSDPKNFQTADENGNLVTDTDAFQQAWKSYKAGDYDGAIGAVNNIKKGGTGANTGKDPVLKQGMDYVASGALSADDLPKFVQASKSGDAATIGALLGHKTPANDPASDRALADAKAAYPNLPESEQIKIARGWIKSKTDPTGTGESIVDVGSGTQRPVNKDAMEMFSDKEKANARAIISESVDALQGLQYSRDALQGTPNAAGASGELSARFGGAASAVADMLLGKEAGNAVDKWTEASQDTDFRNSVKTLAFQLAQPLIKGAGGRLSTTEITMMESIVGGLDWHHSYQQTQAAFDNLQGLYTRSVVLALKKAAPPSQDIITDKAAQNARGQFLVQKMGLTNEMAVDVLHGEINSLSGKPIVTYKSMQPQVAGDTPFVANDPNVKAQFQTLRTQAINGQ